MNSSLNLTKLVLALLIAAAPVGVAFAGEGNGEPFPNHAIGGTIVANQVLSDTGSQATPSYGRGVTVLTQGDLLPSNGSNSIVQTVNSLPRDFEAGTVAYAQAQSVQRWALAQAASATRLVAASTDVISRFKQSSLASIVVASTSGAAGLRSLAPCSTCWCWLLVHIVRAPASRYSIAPRRPGIRLVTYQPPRRRAATRP